MNARMRARLVFLSSSDPRDRRRWSGTTNSLYLALQQRDDTILSISGGVFETLARAARKLLRIFGVHCDLRFSKPFSWVAGLWVSLRLGMLQADMVVAVAASSYLAFLRSRKPIIYISDTTFAAIERLYPEFQTYPTWLRRHGNALERRSLRRACHVIYPSEWARQSAIDDYDIDGGKIRVLPFGPNITSALVNQFYIPKDTQFRDTLRMLYVAAEWERKNGDLVLEIGRSLRRFGFPCQLFLVGRIPPQIKAEDGVEIIGYLDKNNLSDLTRLCQLYAMSHFFIMPTTADAFGIVFSEAQAFGCPSITCEVGGTATAVLNDQTGIVLPLTATAEDFAARVKDLLQEPAAYALMSKNARLRYEQEANWDAWADTILQLAAGSR